VNVSVAEVLAGAEVRAVPLSAECVGYLILAAADQVGAAPRRIGPSDVLLFEDGGVRVTGGRATDAPSAEADLRSVLDVLLLRASAPTSGLLRASRRKPGAGVEALVRELETALIPVNRAAAKRALARLERETVRALESGRISRLPPAPESAEPPSAAPPLASAPHESVAPPVASVAPPEVSEVPLDAALTPDASTAIPPLAALRRALTPAPHTVVAVDVVAWSPLPQQSAPVELVERTIVMAPVAPRPEPEPPLAETRPEPVVLRASARPPAPIPVALLPEPAQAEPVRTEPLPRVMASAAYVSAVPEVTAVVTSSPPNVTPVLGSRVWLSDAEPRPPVASAEPPVASAEPPVASAEPPVASAEPPVASAEPPVASAESPAASAELDDSPFIAESDIEVELDFAPVEAPTELSVAEPPPEFSLAEAPTQVAAGPAGELDVAEAVVSEPSVAPPVVAELMEPSAAEPPVEVVAPPPVIEEALVVSAEPPAAEPAAAEPPARADVFVVAEAEEEAYFEVTFEPEEQTMLPDDAELLYSQGSDWTEPCPPLEAESMLPPLDLGALASSLPASAPDDEPPPSNEWFEPLPLAPESTELHASEESSELPPWMTAVMDVHTAVTPPPRVALPEPRPSDVDELLSRLDEAPLAVDELRTGLKRLAGMEPTPPPPGTVHRD
jgi:hypothetical protein